MLYYQRSNGGWPQPGGDAINYNRILTSTQKQQLIAEKNNLDATIDDKSTTHEINYLVASFKQTQNDDYRKAAERGIIYLLTAQKKNGGWAQFYPDSSSYRKQITYNDNAMVDVLWVMKSITDGTNSFDVVDKQLVPKAQKAVDRGVDCILKTQYSQKGILTAWCAQHDRITLQPTGARTFELPSLSGNESVGILEFLMSIDNPSDRIRKSVRAATAWLESVRLPDIATKIIIDPSQPKGKDVVVVQEPGSTRWARFYDLDTNKPFFCGRNGIKKYALAEIENERRVGYAWYGIWPAKLLATDYPNWAKKWGK
ncbi:pectate lyase [Spirosoma endbachense]|uniref:Pectate lyase n=1 Tax=Spirosoma endbachense TaxID=2666025 RepID=A0A6P1W773_9BACT|nr:pectate lyase [Spirosoma endbachense]QHV99887.1 pectate lyase [Spirosoma endbachense]